MKWGVLYTNAGDLTVHGEGGVHEADVRHSEVTTSSTKAAPPN